MASVLGRIQNFKASLTPSEDKVATYLLANPDEALDGSIHEVAKKSGVSVASVSRLAATLGYRDWKELRLGLVKDSVEITNPVFAKIALGDSDAAVVEKVFNTNVLSIQETYKQLDMQAVQKVVEAIKKADRVVFLGSAGSGCIARDEAIRFSHLELSADAYTETFHMILQAARMKKGQIAFGFSNTGRSAPTVKALAEARKNKALTVGISNHRNSPLEAVSDVFFCTSLLISGELTAALTARTAVLCIMDAIYVLSAQHGRIADKVEYLDTLLQSTVRIPKNGRA